MVYIEWRTPLQGMDLALCLLDLPHTSCCLVESMNSSILHVSVLSSKPHQLSQLMYTGWLEHLVLSFVCAKTIKLLFCTCMFRTPYMSFRRLWSQNTQIWYVSANFVAISHSNEPISELDAKHCGQEGAN